jgi:hypothetical protein
MTDITRDEVGPLYTSYIGYISFFSAIIIFVAFFLLFGHTSIWYDEANYLVIAGAIREIGYPIWFGDPDRPRIFLDSPPGLLYLMSVFSTYVSTNLFLLRLSNSVIFVVVGFLSLLVYIRKKGLDIMLLSITALFCAFTYFFIVEFVQVRMDLPLAALSFLVLVLAALAEFELKERSERKQLNRKLFSTLALLLCASALSFLMKFQAICLTACLFLHVLLSQDFRRFASWLPLVAHIAGSVIGLLVLVVLVMSNPFVPGAAALHHIAHNLERLAGPSSSLLLDASQSIAVFKSILPKVIVPAMIFGVVKVTTSSEYGRDQLFRLSVLMTVVVVAFNMAVHRMPAAGGYYMIQAAIPLGYILAQSFWSLLRANRLWAVLILTCALIFHAILNFQFGGGGPQRSTSWFKDLAGPAGRLDGGKLVAANVAPSLRSEELLLLDGPNQSRMVPYWLNRSDRYGYLFDMDPIRAESLLYQRGPRRVGALVFFGDDTFAKLNSREWSRVEALIARDFVRSMRVENAPGWIVFRRSD